MEVQQANCSVWLLPFCCSPAPCLPGPDVTLCDECGFNRVAVAAQLSPRRAPCPTICHPSRPSPTAPRTLRHQVELHPSCGPAPISRLASSPAKRWVQDDVRRPWTGHANCKPRQAAAVSAEAGRQLAVVRAAAHTHLSAERDITPPITPHASWGADTARCKRCGGGTAEPMPSLPGLSSAHSW